MLSEWDLEQIREIVRQELIEVDAVEALRKKAAAEADLTIEVDALIRLVAGIAGETDYERERRQAWQARVRHELSVA